MRVARAGSVIPAIYTKTIRQGARTNSVPKVSQRERCILASRCRCLIVYPAIDPTITLAAKTGQGVTKKQTSIAAAASAYPSREAFLAAT